MLQVFWLEPTAFVERSLRRYVSGTTNPCPDATWSYHNASASVGRVEKPLPTPDSYESLAPEPGEFVDDARWPVRCHGCAYEFTGADVRQVNDDRLYSGAPDGKLYTLRNCPPGSMWDAWWYGRHAPWACGVDGICLMVKCPNGREWHVDGRASNCTDPTNVTHRCWTRAGNPRTGNVTVGKEFGPTCGAGAGSIIAGDYHGFLRNGQFSNNL